MYDIDTVLDHYMRTALWSETDDSTPSGGDPLDSNWGVEDIVPDAVARMRVDVADFLALIERERPGVWDDMNGTVWEDPGQVGHDFWLTRNGHGTGFWDRYHWHPAGVNAMTGDAYPEYGDRVKSDLGEFLAKWSKTYGDARLYVGDDRRIHHE